jgi:hypothetical protein
MNLKKELNNPDTIFVNIEMTEEVKARVERVSNQVIDILGQGTHGPGEALIVLHYVTETLKETVGVKAMFSTERSH